MPLPVIPVVAGIVALMGLVVGGKFVTNSIKRMLAGKRVAILGGQEVGKTTLLYYLRDGKHPGSQKRTLDPAVGQEFELKVGRKSVKFHVLNDLPGHQGLGLSDWKNAFVGADYVWYLFRSDLIVSGNKAQIEMVSNHLIHFKSWMKNAKKPTIILVGTWADHDATYEDQEKDFVRILKSSDPIKLGAVKLNNAQVVVGSLQDEKGAAKLVKAIRSYIK